MNQAPGGSRSRVVLVRLWLVCLSALLALLLAACGAGVSTPRTGGSTSSTTTGGAVMTIRPCLGSYSGGGNPAVTLTNSSSNVTGSAHTGDTIEIRMDGHHKWTLTSVKPSDTLTSITQEGLFDSASGDCVWIFHASAAGDATITFTGLALCDPTQVCPQYAILQTFKLHIS